MVPDYILYEKMTWPSRFNHDHKQSFSPLIKRSDVVRPNHWHVDEDLIPLLKSFGIGKLARALESRNFNFNAGLLDQTSLIALAQIGFVAKKCAK